MIEKLERHIRVEKGLTQDIKISCPSEQSEMVSKINELVDAVNEIMTWRFETDDEPAENGNCAKNAQDPYNEQHKWIGKLCRFWDDGCDSNYISLLKQIDDDETPFTDDKGVYWEHCEPVKPDDDIIYKGE